MEFNLVTDWRSAWKWISTWALAAIVWISVNGVPDWVLEVVPMEYHNYVLTAVAICGIIGRLVKQPTLKQIKM